MWTRIISANSVLLMAAVAAGWVSSAWRGASVAPSVSAIDHGRVLADAAYIFAMNLRVVGSLVAGVCTLGLLTLAHLAWLGYSLGYGLSSLTRGTSGALILVLSYLPFEFLAFILSASAAQGTAYMIVRMLAGGQTAQPARAAAVLASALVLLAVGAGIEAWVKPAIGALGAALP
jgi:uncharacterized membrane protein SpoIIM required for sporulation